MAGSCPAVVPISTRPRARLQVNARGPDTAATPRSASLEDAEGEADQGEANGVVATVYECEAQAPALPQIGGCESEPDAAQTHQQTSDGGVTDSRVRADKSTEGEGGEQAEDERTSIARIYDCRRNPSSHQPRSRLLLAGGVHIRVVRPRCHMRRGRHPQKRAVAPADRRRASDLQDKCVPIGVYPPDPERALPIRPESARFPLGIRQPISRCVCRLHRPRRYHLPEPNGRSTTIQLAGASRSNAVAQPRPSEAREPTTQRA